MREKKGGKETKTGSKVTPEERQHTIGDTKAETSMLRSHRPHFIKFF